MADKVDNLFPPAVVLPIPNKKKNKTSSMGDAIKVENRTLSSNNIPQQDNEVKYDVENNDISHNEEPAKSEDNTAGLDTSEILPIDSVDESPAQVNVPINKNKIEKKKKVDSKPDQKREALTKRKSNLRTNYIIDAQVVKFVEEISLSLKHEEILDFHSSTVASELMNIGMYFYKRYLKKVNGLITSGEQIKEFTLREFEREFHIIEE